MKKKYVKELMDEIKQIQKEVTSKKQLYILVGMEKVLYCALTMKNENDLRVAKRTVTLVAYGISRGKK